ncbi:E3 ubiquitin-protein ligase TRIM21-like [Micropterus dolomieu]|uniref:E3 ubiquitin-protein ligase TRIM21-like n=1 Tax=Micropterus dolomieu TaxID=147949 RepID=UPI001E8CC238|nr:E3 ubiquitin-protein ligase TRIM21-like [Micropterus dolomieu]
MSAASCLLTEDQFLCSICLDVFTDPVTIPCGHSFCKTCITEHWNINVLCQCPNCEEVFNTKPELQVNTFICEIAAQFRQSAQQKASSSSSEQQAAKPGEVPCDVCTGTKLKALKSCLVCLVSYCETHLEPHLTMTGLKRHQLIDPVENLEGRMCTKHDKLLELFCKTDQMCVCMLCSVSDHKTHDVVPLKEEYEGKKAELIDHLHLLQSLPSLNAAPLTKDWTEVSVRPPSYEGTVRRAVNQLEETLSEQMKKLLSEAELERIQLYAVDVTLDPDTANPYLILSYDGKQVKYGDVWKNLSDNPKRFSLIPSVLAKQSFSSGRFYYKVQVKGKTEWDLGVARESINRKGYITQRPQDGYWTICLINESEYFAYTDPPVRLSLKSRPEKVGVFVDYEEGLVSFYDVDAAALIYSFTGCRFTEKLYPYFSPDPNYGGKNSAPLIITQ